MKIKRIYNDEHGKSHFGEVEIPLADGGPIGLLSESMALEKSFSVKRPLTTTLNGTLPRLASYCLS